MNVENMSKAQQVRRLKQLAGYLASADKQTKRVAGWMFQYDAMAVDHPDAWAQYCADVDVSTGHSSVDVMNYSARMSKPKAVKLKTDQALDLFKLKDALDGGDVIQGHDVPVCTVQRVLTAQGSVYEMKGGKGDHRISVESSNATRLWQHWNGFKQNNAATPAAACNKCGGWTSFGGMSQHAKSQSPVMGRVGCVC